MSAESSMATAESLTVFHRPRASRASGRLRALALAIGSAALLIALLVAGICCAPAADTVDFAARNLAPCPAHLFGTDWLGRDMLARTLAGLAVSAGVGLGATLVSSLIALGLALAASWGKAANAVVSWLIDLLLGIPHIVLLLLISFALGKGFLGVVVGIALTHWPSLTRVLRAEILQTQTSGAVAVARKLGQSRSHIARRHLMPALVPQFFVGIVLTFPHAVLHEASVTFLGFGLPLDVPSIGGILSEAFWPSATGGSRCFRGWRSSASSCCFTRSAPACAGCSTPTLLSVRRRYGRVCANVVFQLCGSS